MDRVAWRATVHEVTKQSDTTEGLNNNYRILIKGTGTIGEVLWMSFQPIVFHNSWAGLSSIWAFFSFFFSQHPTHPSTLSYWWWEGWNSENLFPKLIADWLLLDSEYRDMWVSLACERRLETFSSLLACLAVCVSDTTWTQVSQESFFVTEAAVFSSIWILLALQEPVYLAPLRNPQQPLLQASKAEKGEGLLSLAWRR